MWAFHSLWSYWGSFSFSMASTRRAEPMMWWSVSTFLSISARSMSIWTILACLANVAGFRATRSEKRQPTAMSRSHSSQAVLEALEPCMPIMPVVRGWLPEKPPPPMRLMATGASSFSANALNSLSARPSTTPPPQMTKGRWACPIISRRMSTSSRFGVGFFSSWSRFSSRIPAQPRFSRQGTNSYSISTLGKVTSFKKSISTGPGRPLAATAKAWRMTAGIVAGSRTKKVAFVIGMAMPVMSTSWKASLPNVASVTLQVRKTTGEESR